MKNVDRLFDLFDDEQVSWDAARTVGRIPATDKILTKKNHAILRVSPQTTRENLNAHSHVRSRYCMPRSTAAPFFRASSKERKRPHVCVRPYLRHQAHCIADHAFLEPARQNAYLVALAALIKSVPKSTYTHEMPSVCASHTKTFLCSRQ